MLIWWNQCRKSCREADQGSSTREPLGRAVRQRTRSLERRNGGSCVSFSEASDTPWRACAYCRSPSSVRCLSRLEVATECDKPARQEEVKMLAVCFPRTPSLWGCIGGSRSTQLYWFPWIRVINDAIDERRGLFALDRTSRRRPDPQFSGRSGRIPSEIPRRCDVRQPSRRRCDRPVTHSRTRHCIELFGSPAGPKSSLSMVAKN